MNFAPTRENILIYKGNYAMIFPTKAFNMVFIQIKMTCQYTDLSPNIYPNLLPNLLFRYFEGLLSLSLYLRH